MDDDNVIFTGFDIFLQSDVTTLKKSPTKALTMNTDLSNQKLMKVEWLHKFWLFPLNIKFYVPQNQRKILNTVQSCTNYDFYKCDNK